MNHRQIFVVRVREESRDKSKEIDGRQPDMIDIDQTGFCTAIDEDRDQTMAFKINAYYHDENETYMELICMDNGYPSLSVTQSISCSPLLFIDLLGN